MVVLKSDFKIHLPSCLCKTSQRTHFGTHLGVSIKLPLGVVFSCTNGPCPVEKIGMDEFPLLGKSTRTKQKHKQKSHKRNF